MSNLMHVCLAALISLGMIRPVPPAAAARPQDHIKVIVKASSESEMITELSVHSRSHETASELESWYAAAPDTDGYLYLAAKAGRRCSVCG